MTGVRPEIAVTGPLIPGERIRAHGFEPVPVRPRTSGRHPPTAGVCAVAHGWAEAVAAEEARVAAAVLTTRCDQLRRAAEALRGRIRLPVFVMNIPVTCGTETARRLYREETGRLDAFLSRLEGASRRPAPAEDGASSAAPAAGSLPGAHRVGLLGCCATEADEAVLQMLRQLGLLVVANAMESPLDAIRPTIAQRPNAPFFEWLCRLGKVSRIEGWVLLRQTWCDLYHAEVPRLKRATALPWLDLETGAHPALEALRTRAEAFVEVLENRRRA